MLVTLIILQIHETMWFLLASRFRCLHSLSPHCPDRRGKVSSMGILLLGPLGLLGGQHALRGLLERDFGAGQALEPLEARLAEQIACVHHLVRLREPRCVRPGAGPVCSASPRQFAWPLTRGSSAPVQASPVTLPDGVTFL